MGLENPNIDQATVSVARWDQNAGHLMQSCASPTTPSFPPEKALAGFLDPDLSA